jgi:hypothetical protein
MAAFRAGGPRRLGRVVYQQGEGPLYIPPLQRHQSWSGRCSCRSGPWPRKRSFRSRRFLAFTAFGAMGPSYKGMTPSYKGIDRACRPNAHATCSRTSAEGSSARARSASTTAGVVGALPSPTARFRSHRS